MTGRFHCHCCLPVWILSCVRIRLISRRRRAGIFPDAVVGDFDHEHTSAQAHGNVVRVPSEKDDTDTMLCIKYAIDAGAE